MQAPTIPVPADNQHQSGLFILLLLNEVIIKEYVIITPPKRFCLIGAWSLNHPPHPLRKMGNYST